MTDTTRSPRVTDFIGQPVPYQRPEHVEGSRLVVEKMLWEPGSRLSPSKWVSAYARAIGRPQDVDPWPLPSAVRSAGQLLARALFMGWVEEAPGPRGGRGWSITAKGLQGPPMPGRRHA